MTAPPVPLRESLDRSLSFLVSLVFHLFLLLALALGEFSQKQAASLTVSMAAPEEDVPLLDAPLDLPVSSEFAATKPASDQLSPEIMSDEYTPDLLEIELVEVDRRAESAAVGPFDADVAWMWT